MEGILTEHDNTASAMPIIEFRGGSKTYPTGTHAIEDVNIRITAGEFVFVEALRVRAKVPL